MRTTSALLESASELKGSTERLNKLLKNSRMYKDFRVPERVLPLLQAVERLVDGEDFNLAQQKTKDLCVLVSSSIRTFVRNQIINFEQRIEHVYCKYEAEIQATYGQVHQLIAELKHLTKDDVYDHAVVSNKMRVLEDMLNRAAAQQEKIERARRVQEIKSLIEENKKLAA